MIDLGKKKYDSRKTKKKKKINDLQRQRKVHLTDAAAGLIFFNKLQRKKTYHQCKVIAEIEVRGGNQDRGSNVGIKKQIEILKKISPK